MGLESFLFCCDRQQTTASGTRTAVLGTANSLPPASERPVHSPRTQIAVPEAVPRVLYGVHKRDLKVVRLDDKRVLDRVCATRPRQRVDLHAGHVVAVVLEVVLT